MFADEHRDRRLREAEASARVVAMYAAGVAAVQEEFDERGLGPADLIVEVIINEALAAVAMTGEGS